MFENVLKNLFVSGQQPHFWRKHRRNDNHNCSYFLIRNRLNPYHENEISFSTGNVKKNRNNIRNDMYILIYIFQFLNFTFY